MESQTGSIVGNGVVVIIDNEPPRWKNRLKSEIMVRFFMPWLRFVTLEWEPLWLWIKEPAHGIHRFREVELGRYCFFIK
jgi:hypothetical protein